MTRRRSQQLEPEPELPESEDGEIPSDEDYDDDSSGSEEEVTLNILERQPRITAGKRSTKPVGKDAETDQAFWGSDQHRTWEESESDSDVSYDMEESEEESASDSELDEEEEDESEEDEEEDEEETRRKRPRFQAYKVPDTKQGAPKRKTIVRRKPKPVAETPKSESEITRRETRDTTRARTLEVHNRPTPVSVRRKATSSGKSQHNLTQEQLLEEARIVEEWNKADYDAYLRFTELSEKERNALMQKRRQRGPKNVYTIVTKSFIQNGKVTEELKIVPPILDEPAVKKKDAKPPPPVKDVADVLRLDQSRPDYSNKSHKYRYPYGSMAEFDTIDEFRAIHQREQDAERLEAENLLNHLHSLVPK